MKQPYAEIKILIFAEEKEINGANEMALSDAVSDVGDKVQKLVERGIPEYDFEYEVTTG